MRNKINKKIFGILFGTLIISLLLITTIYAENDSNTNGFYVTECDIFSGVEKEIFIDYDIITNAMEDNINTLSTISYDPEDLLNTTGASTRAIIGDNNMVKTTMNQICLINCNKNGKDNWGTGVLIAPNIVLTAAHVIYDYSVFGGVGLQ